MEEDRRKAIELSREKVFRDKIYFLELEKEANFQKGKQEAEIKCACNLINMGLSLEDVKKATELPMEVIDNIEQGIQKKALEDAENLLKIGLSAEKIAEATKLPIDVVMQLKNEMK